MRRFDGKKRVLCSLCNREDHGNVSEDVPVICSRCVQRLLKAKQEEIIRSRDLAWEKGLYNKVDLFESFIRK